MVLACEYIECQGVDSELTNIPSNDCNTMWASDGGGGDECDPELYPVPEPSLALLTFLLGLGAAGRRAQASADGLAARGAEA